MVSSSSLGSYVKIMRIGQGAFGDVWLAEDVISKRHVALKKLISKESREGFSKTAIREIVLLTNLKHRNIVDLYGVVFSRPQSSDDNGELVNQLPNGGALSNLYVNSVNRGSIWMVFEYLPYDLSGYMEGLKLEGKLIKVVDIKVIIRQLLESLEFCHMHNTIHRDIKCANLLISSDGVVKLADFGLARYYNVRYRTLTNRVVTLWYRSPELLLGAQSYDTPVDMWSVGCILGELILQQPLFCSETEVGVLKMIGETLGPPPSDVVQDLKKLPLWNDYENNPLLPILGSGTGNKYRQMIHRVEEKAGSQGLDLLLQLLQYSSSKRLKAKQALSHPWLQNGENNESLPDHLDMSVFTQKKQFHSLSARKLRDKLQGRLKVPSTSEVGGAVNAIIGKAYNVGTLREQLKDKHRNSIGIIQNIKEGINEQIDIKKRAVVTISQGNINTSTIKRSRSRERISPDPSRWKTRSSFEHRNLRRDRKDRVEHEWRNERDIDYDRNRHLEYSDRDDYYGRRDNCVYPYSRREVEYSRTRHYNRSPSPSGLRRRLSPSHRSSGNDYYYRRRESLHSYYDNRARDYNRRRD
ncbi:putative cell division control protein 2 [Cryptosporidium serpentis]